MACTRITPKTETDTSVSGVTVTRQGGICVLTLAERGFVTGWTTIGTIPSGYRPAAWMKAPLIATGGSGYCGILSLNTTGELQVYVGSELNNKAVAGGVSYKLA